MLWSTNLCFCLSHADLKEKRMHKGIRNIPKSTNAQLHSSLDVTYNTKCPGWHYSWFVHCSCMSTARKKILNRLEHCKEKRFSNNLSVNTDKINEKRKSIKVHTRLHNNECNLAVPFRSSNKSWFPVAPFEITILPTAPISPLKSIESPSHSTNA